MMKLYLSLEVMVQHWQATPAERTDRSTESQIDKMNEIVRQLGQLQKTSTLQLNLFLSTIFIHESKETCSNITSILSLGQKN